MLFSQRESCRSGSRRSGTSTNIENRLNGLSSMYFSLSTAALQVLSHRYDPSIEKYMANISRSPLSIVCR
nr:hypothetical protein Q903MT_gene137 [Picea sitchensis]